METWALAADENGIVSMLDVRRAGLATPDVAALVKGERLTRLARGWYALGRVESAEDRHVLETRAMLRATRVARSPRTTAPSCSCGCRRTGPICPQSGSAGVRSGRPGPGRDSGSAARSHRRPSSTSRWCPRWRSSSTASRPAPWLPSWPADGLLHRKASPDDLLTALDWVRYHPHTSALRSTLERADGRHESPGQTVLADILHTMGLRVTPQVAIAASSFRAVVDLLVDGEAVVIEFDGKIKDGRSAHTPDPFGRQRSPEEVVREENRREDQIRELGNEVVRVTWSDLRNPRKLADRIHRAIARARRRRAA